jgi:diacylglycerol kinase family enzyme
MWFRPQLFDPEKIEMFRGSSVRIETARKAHFQVDGEYLGKVKEVSATILPSQIHISLPEHPLL